MIFELSSVILFLAGLFLSGYCLSLAFFEKTSLLKRIVLALIFGALIPPLFLLIENTLFSVEFDFIAVSANIFLVSIVGLSGYIARLRLKIK